MKQRIECHLEEFNHLFVESAEFISFADYEKWFETLERPERYKLAVSLLSAWNLTERNGEPLPQPSPEFDDAQLPQLDSRVHAWLMQAISRMLNERVKIPLAKESE